MDKLKRIIDINGQVIVYPEHYFEALESANKMIDKLEKDNVDRSDMYLILLELLNEAKFSITFSKDRK